MATSSRIEWVWNASANPFSKTEPPKWRPYSDVDSRMIEQAYAAKQDKAMLDEYYIDFALKRQVSNVDKNRQRPVQRMERDQNDARGVRKDRFSPNPVELNGSTIGQCGFISCFIKEVAKFLKINREQLPSKDPKFIPMILEKAAIGIIAEGNNITPGRPREATFIAELLRAKKANSFKEIWEFCANLYTWDSFLYKQINDTMRLVGNPQHEQVWRSKISTIGPYCLLLWDNPFTSEMIKPGTVLYRGAELADNLIRSFQDECTREPKIWHTLQGFTSCTRNRTTAEQFGNVLFIMKSRTAFTIDLTQLSEYRQEEEELLLPGISFTVNQVETDKSKNKYLIYLSVHQRHIKSNQQQPKRPNTASRPNPPISDRDLDRDNFDRDFDRMNLRDEPTGHDDLLAALACPNADFDDLSLLIYRYGRNIDWQ